MLKYANVAKVGDYIRAYDFKPMKDREDCFIEGTVVKIDNKGFDCFVVKCENDSCSDSECKGRVGQDIFVPFEVSFLEYDGRVMNLSN